MREIKFRYIVKYRRTTGENIEIFILTLDEIQKRIGSWKELDSFLDSVGLSNYEIIARNQFTGLKDDNGKDIYDGDIVKYPESKISTLWNEFVGKVAWNDTPPSFVVIGADNHWTLTSSVEVVGNIYENSELLINIK